MKCFISQYSSLCIEDKVSSDYIGTRRIMVFIDAGYLRQNLANVFGDDILNYQIFIQSLIAEFNNSTPLFFLERIRVYYYDAILEDEDPKTEQQRSYFRSIIDIPGFEDRLGNIKKTKKERNRQKGVDSLIAVDMVSKAYQDHYDIALLIAGDEDHLPVVEAVKNTGKRVYGAFFENHITQNLKDSFDMSFILSQEWLADRKIKLKASILEFQFPEEIMRGEQADILIKIKGSLNHGFLELLIVDSKNNQESHPDPKTSKSKLYLVDETYDSTWKVHISDKIEKGTCRAYLQLYENISKIDSKEKIFSFKGI